MLRRLLATTALAALAAAPLQAQIPLLIEDTNELKLQVGPNFSLLPMMDFGLEVAYFSEADMMGLSPNNSIGLLMLDRTASYNSTFEGPRGSWFTVGLGLRFWPRGHADFVNHFAGDRDVPF